MDPATAAMLAQVAIQILQVAIANLPALNADLQKLFASGTPTASDFAALRASIASETYGQFVPASALPAAETGAAAPAEAAAPAAPETATGA